MTVSSTITLYQFLPDDSDFSLEGLPGSLNSNSYVYGVLGSIVGTSDVVVPLLAIQNPYPKDGLEVDAYRTVDPDTWSDSPTNAPGLSDSLRFAYGRYGSRYRNLDDFAGAIIHQRNFSEDSSADITSFLHTSSAVVEELESSVVGDSIVYGSERVSGSAYVKQYDFIVSAYPPPYSYNNNINTDVWIKLSNYTYPLNSGTVTLYLDGVEASPLTVTPYYGGVGGFTALWPNSIQFDYDSQINVLWTVYDEAPTPNKITFEYWFRTIADVTAPRITESYPQDNDENVSVSSCISFFIRDYETGVDISSLELYINNVYIPLSSLSVSVLSTLDGYSVSYCPDDDFLYNDYIAVSIYVKDNADPSNYIFHTYGFTTEESRAPRAILSDPLPCRDYVLLYKDVSVFVVDGGHGIDETSFLFSVDDYTVEYRLLPILYRED